VSYEGPILPGTQAEISPSLASSLVLGRDRLVRRRQREAGHWTFEIINWLPVIVWRSGARAGKRVHDACGEKFAIKMAVSTSSFS
jgi:hypothetical protein